MEDNFSLDGARGGGHVVINVSPAMESDGNTDEASLPCPLFIPCCAAWFLTGLARVSSGPQPGAGPPALWDGSNLFRC